MTINPTKQITENLLKHKFKKCKVSDCYGGLTYANKLKKVNPIKCPKCLGTGTQLFVIEDEGVENRFQCLCGYPYESHDTIYDGKTNEVIGKSFCSDRERI